VALAFAPVLFEGDRALDVAARLCVLIVLAASFDLLLGYAGIVSLAHTMFFGLGAYGVALASLHLGPGPEALVAGAAAGALAAAAVALVIGLFSLRLRAIFFAMISFVVASVVTGLVSQFPELTGGENGLSFPVLRALTGAEIHGNVPPFTAGPVVFDGLQISGRIAAYYLVFGCALVLFLVMLRLVASPFGRVLQAIRENDQRTEAIGYSVLRYRIAVTMIAAVFASLAGALYAIWLGFVSPNATLSFDLMIGILLMVVIGGMGTLYGAVIGAVLLVCAQTYLRGLMGPELVGALPPVVADLPVLSELLHPDRWLLWLGVLLVLCVHLFPAGVVGILRGRRG
jgi:branched-chain amino acid transport system permease protein